MLTHLNLINYLLEVLQELCCHVVIKVLILKPLTFFLFGTALQRQSLPHSLEYASGVGPALTSFTVKTDAKIPGRTCAISLSSFCISITKVLSFSG